MSAPFEFKQFKLQQEKSAFKLGTDSVLLGAWLPVNHYKKILDMGAGTGILSLMLAQRFENSNITGVEIDSPSVVDCANNFAQSKWNQRLKIINEDISIWSQQNNSEKFDLIVTNPPYFINSLKNPDTRKSIARHSDTISNDKMVELLKAHLSDQGAFAYILPTSEFNQFQEKLQNNGFHLTQLCNISSFEGGDVIRKMGFYSKQGNNVQEETQYLYNADKSRSDWYKKISDDFYIK